jgi:hypothetical protein
MDASGLLDDGNKDIESLGTVESGTSRSGMFCTGKVLLAVSTLHSLSKTSDAEIRLVKP